MRLRPTRPTVLETIASLLAVAIVWTYVLPQSFRPRPDPRAAAESDIGAIHAALATYRADTGEYPTTAQGLAALVTAPALPPHPWNWRGPYLLRPVPNDPWGAPYTYRRADDAGREGFILASYGADERPGGARESADVMVRR